MTEPRDSYISIVDSVKNLGIKSNFEPIKQGFLHKRGLKNVSWKKRWFVLTEKKLLYFENKESSHPKGSINLKEVGNIKTISDEKMPYSFALPLVGGRRYIIAASDEFERFSWIETIEHCVSEELSDTNSSILSVEEEEPKSIQKGGKNILNECKDTIESLHHPCELSQILLNDILQIYKTIDYVSTPEYMQSFRSKMSAFQKDISALATVDLSFLNEKEMLCFFLNIYHTLLIHITVEFGKSNSLVDRLNHMKKNYYRVSGHELSLIEMEHCILREPLSSPKTLFGFLVPKFKKGDKRADLFCRVKKDPRINFVLHYGSLSSPSYVWTFTRNKIDEQLDHATHLFFRVFVRISEDRKSLVLPSICKYYSRDFGKNVQEVHEFLSKYLSHSELTGLQNGLKLQYDQTEWAHKDFAQGFFPANCQ